MKIAIIGANGKVGKQIVKEALNKKHDVTVIVRNENQSEANKIIQKDLFDLKMSDLSNFDAVINAAAFWTPETLSDYTNSLKYLSDILSGKNIYLLIVGGTGSLFVDKEHKVQLYQTSDYPEKYRPLAAAKSESFNELLKRNDILWTYVCPPKNFDEKGKRTGKYLLRGDEFTLNDKGESYISYADFAVALIDEAEKREHNRQKISILGI